MRSASSGCIIGRWRCICINWSNRLHSINRHSFIQYSVLSRIFTILSLHFTTCLPKWAMFLYTSFCPKTQHFCAECQVTAFSRVLLGIPVFCHSSLRFVTDQHLTGCGFAHPPHWLLTYKAGCGLKVHSKWWYTWRNKNRRWITGGKVRRTSTQILASVPFPSDLIVFSRDWGPQFHNLRFHLT